MELLIPGLLLVAFMVWASTRIKRNAADAFAAEVIDTREFTLNKPDGWLSIAVPKLPFEAYTKDYAPAPNDDIRLGTATLEISNGTLDNAEAAITGGADILEQLREKVGDVHYRVITQRRHEDETDTLELIKLADVGGRLYTFRIKTIEDTTPEFRRDIEGMVDSFQVKTV